MATDKIIIYDDTCPMCVWYTGVFVKTGLLRPENRRAFSSLDDSDLVAQIDWERSRDEIPLIDKAAGVTRYGIDSMLAVIGSRFPVLAKLANHSFVRWLPRLLYKIVTYNRRAISGATIPAFARAYGPHFSYFYRYLYLILISVIFSGVVTALEVTSLVQWGLLGIGLLPLVSIWSLPHRQALHYAGIMLTPLIPVALLLWPVVYWPSLLPVMGVLAGYLWWRMLSRRRRAARNSLSC